MPDPGRPGFALLAVEMPDAAPIEDIQSATWNVTLVRRVTGRVTLLAGFRVESAGQAGWLDLRVEAVLHWHIDSNWQP